MGEATMTRPFFTQAWHLMRDVATPRRVPMTVYDVLGPPPAISLLPVQRRRRVVAI